MALREKMAAGAQPYLEPGEQIRHVFGAQSNSGWWAGIAVIAVFFNTYRMVAVTDRRIVVFDTGKWNMTKPKSIIGNYARNTRIGPPSGLWWKCQSLGDTLYIHKRFHKDVEAADAELI